MINIGTPPAVWPKILGCDLETTGLRPWRGKILSVALSDGTDTWVFLNFHDLSALKDVFEDESILKVFHNAKFDLQWLKYHLNFDVSDVFDTMLAEQVIYAGKRLPVALNDVLGRRLGVLMDKDTREEFIDHPGFDVKPVTNTQLDYIEKDVLYLPELLRLQCVEASNDGLLPSFNIENEAVLAFAALELGGMKLDIPLWHQQATEFIERMQQADALMRGMITAPIHVPGKKAGQPIIKEIQPEDINFGSWQQLTQVFHEYYSFTVPNTAAATLEDLVQRHKGKPVADFTEQILEYRKWQKRLGFDYIKFVDDITGKVQPSWHQLGARTGRVSASKPNPQQTPRPGKNEPNMRHLWCADGDDYIILRADYSQQEPRILAQLSGDPAMIAACNSEDVYVEFGKYMYGKVIEKGSPERHIAKTFVLAVGYGAGADRLHAASGLPIAECLRIRNIIRSTFPVMAKYATKMDRLLQQYGYVTTSTGRRRYFPNKKDRRFSQAVNTPIQGTAADMFKLAFARVHRFLTKAIRDGTIDANSRVWHVVHDEICVHCHIKDRKYVSENIQRIMEEAGHELCPDVLHIAEVEWGKTWDK